MYERFTDRARKVMQQANREAQRFNHEYIGTEHILLGLIAEGSGVATNVLKNLDIDRLKIRREIEKIVQAGPDSVIMSKIPQTPRAKKVIEYAIEESHHLGHNYIGTEHLLLGLVREQQGVAAQILINLGLTLNDVRESVLSLLGHNEIAGTRTGGQKKSKTPVLDSFGWDFTDLARQGKLDPQVERHGQVLALASVLGCRQRNSAVLVGEPGVGKRAVVAGLAQAIVVRTAPDWMEGCRIVELSLSRLWIGTRDDVALDRLNAILAEVRRSADLILFLSNELRSLAAPRGSSAQEAVQTLWLDALQRSEVRCILAGTPAEYQNCIARQIVLDRCCQVVPVPPATVEETLAILRGLREIYEAHRGVRYTEDALTAVAELADRHLPGALPGKAVLLLDHAGARGCGKGREASRDLRERIARLHEQIDRLDQEKEEAVAEQSFDHAAQLRDQADALKQQRQALLDQEKHLRLTHGGTIEAADVSDTLAQLTGANAPPDALSSLTGIKKLGD